MARNRTLIALALLASCKSDVSDPKPVKKPPEPTIETSPECAAKVKELAPYLEQLEMEQASHEIDFGYTLQVIDRPALPIATRKIDAVEIKEKAIAAFDASESDHANGTLADTPTQKALEDKLAQMFATKPDPADKSFSSGDLLRIDVDTKATWGDVVRVADAATKAGYSTAVFGFTATSKLAAPMGAALKITDAEAIAKANRRMEEIRETTCKAWDRAVMHHEWTADRAANARANAKETADAIAACNCAADPDEVRLLKWIDSHWYQATIRVPVTIQLGASGTPIAQPKGTPWSDAHKAILDASGPIKLVAN